MITRPRSALLAAVLTAGLVLTGCTGPANAESGTPDWFDVTGFQPEGADPALIDANASAMDVVGVDGLLLSRTGTRVSTPSREARTQRNRAHASGLEAQLLVSNYADGDFSEPIARRMLRSPANRSHVVRALATDVRSGGWDSVMIDLEALTAADTAGLTAFARELRAAVGDDVRLDIALSASTTAAGYARMGYDVRALRAPLDHLTLMAYDQHGPWEPDAPGPVGSLPWASKSARALATLAPADQIVLGVAGYGYHWKGPRPAGQLSDDQARRRVRKAGITPTWNATAGEWTATLPSDEVLWWSDARSLRERVALAERLGLTGVAVWSLDLSDALDTVH
ncbi:glycosyl hydrolase family 18 (putative chitinase) [Curtobacterium sp. PhB137]|uniref:glycosyl hydrolase family 18 protein n=1 Tax=unclassified Curtobacterium TaxID=257496 RepID=UPI000F513EC1|nr:glycosyl hydrolase family 18 protein [Curtobacterium sp. PhB137]RPE76716.1 glycosyl hydrolase family 18 (putative chitinase) [Curtobacterium sp. PhB137]